VITHYVSTKMTCQDIPVRRNVRSSVGSERNNSALTYLVEPGVHEKRRSEGQKEAKRLMSRSEPSVIALYSLLRIPGKNHLLAK